MIKKSKKKVRDLIQPPFPARPNADDGSDPTVHGGVLPYQCRCAKDLPPMSHILSSYEDLERKSQHLEFHHLALTKIIPLEQPLCFELPFDKIYRKKQNKERATIKYHKFKPSCNTSMQFLDDWEIWSKETSKCLNCKVILNPNNESRYSLTARVKTAKSFQQVHMKEDAP
ncbi:hypothetical protein M9H77_21968 [Catharanthus roseus]|uniref:Uncharacterized protein n=1 Tax=Catharanthus roseus TaxID=4058 RepID=A0ACC0AQW3_CATRO|nr:hypothetical protein M9H77_21968 [Catharanthus roseus]